MKKLLLILLTVLCVSCNTSEPQVYKENTTGKPLLEYQIPKPHKEITSLTEYIHNCEYSTNIQNAKFEYLISVYKNALDAKYYNYVAYDIDGNIINLEKAKKDLDKQREILRIGNWNVYKAQLELDSLRKVVSEKKQQTPIYKTGYINTIVEGTNNSPIPFDNETVNLWNHRSKRDIIITTCTNNEKIIILEEDNTYVKVKTSKGYIGWCMKEWIK